jgi:protease-4
VRARVVALALAFGLATPAVAAPPRATERNPGDGVDRVYHDYSSEGDASSLELNPAMLSSMRGADLTILGYDATDRYTRGSGFGAFFGLNLGFGLASAVGVQVVNPRLDPDVRDFDEAANPDITKLSLGLAADASSQGAFGVAIHGVRSGGRWIERPELDVGSMVRIFNYGSLGVTARLGPADLDTSNLPAHLSVTGEVTVRPLGTPHVELAGGVTQRVLAAEAGDGLQPQGLDGLLPRGRVALRYQGWTLSGEVEQVRTSTLDEATLDRLRGEKTLRGSVAIGAAWDFVSVSGGVHAGVSPGIDGYGIKAQLSSRRQGRVFWPRQVAAERLDLSTLDDERDLIDMLQRIDRAREAGDRTVLVVDARSVGAGWASLHEVREGLVAVRNAGGHVFAYVEDATLRDYYVASAAEKIYVHPGGSLSIYGLSSTMLYLRGALDKLGVQAEVLRINEYKSAGERFTETAPSKFDRIQREALLDDTYGKIVYDIARARGFSKAQVRAFVDDSPHSPQEAVDRKLADEIVFRDELLDRISEDIGAKVEFRIIEDNARTDPWRTAPYVAVVLIEGAIIDGKSRRIPLFGIGFTGGDTIVQTLRDLRDDEACRGIVLRVNSPGGSALASEVIWREVDRTREAFEADPKFSPPIVVSMGDVAASGGYYVSMGTDTVYADPMTITGSIGIIAMHFDVSGLLGKLGISTATFKRGENPDIDSPFSPYSEDQRQRRQRELAQKYDLFITRVADARGMSKEEVDAVGRGHVWSGIDAQHEGLVDHLGGLLAALAEVRRRAGIPGWRQLPLRVLPRKPTLFDLLFEESGNPLGRAGPLSKLAERRKARSVQAQLRDTLPLALDAAMSKLPLSRLFLPQDRATAILPGEIELR